METPTSFDLSQAITQWRERLANVPGIQPVNVSELESHLRDSIAALGAQGLTDEECFFVATHRLGSGAQLGSEFEKVNRRSIWLERVMWMLAGILLLQFVDTVSGTFSFVVMAISKLVGMPSTAIWIVASIASLAISVRLIIAFWRMFNNRTSFVKSGLKRLLQHRWLAALVMLLACVLFAVLNTAPSILFAYFYPIDTAGSAIQGQQIIASASWIVRTLLIVFAFVWLANRYIHPHKELDSAR